ncbi:hypothetical protein ACWC5I_43460, partial [Kitasatospora sp. NPDC001574]
MPADPSFPGLVAALAGHLPGWSAWIAGGAAGLELQRQPWAPALPGPGGPRAPYDAAELTGPDGERLVAVLPPGHPNLLVAALRPDDTDAFVDAPTSRPIPLALSLDQDPAAAAVQIQDVLLPRYRQAVWDARTHAVAGALAAITRAAASWGPDPDDVEEDDDLAYHQEAAAARSRA